MIRKVAVSLVVYKLALLPAHVQMVEDCQTLATLMSEFWDPKVSQIKVDTWFAFIARRVL